MRRYGLVDIPDEPNDIGAVPITRTLTINGTTYDLSADRSWTVGNITGTGTSGQVAYFNGTNSITSSATFAFTPTSQLLLNNSVTAASAIARGLRLTTTLTASANNDVLVGLDISPTFTNGAFTGVRNDGMRITNSRLRISWNGSFTGEPAISFQGPTTNFWGISANTINNELLFWSNSRRYGLSNTSFYNDDSDNVTDLGRTGNRWRTVYATSINSRAANLVISTSTATYLTLFTSTGNLILQNGGTFTDGGQRLQVTGTSILNGFATISGSTTAASAIARGALVSSTLVAAANNDVLVGLDISPTFTNGAFTGVGNYGIRTSGQLRLSSYTTTSSYSGTVVGYLAFDSSGNILTTATPSASMAIGGSITSATAGSVLFAGASGVLAQDNANFFWDDTNNRLGLGTATPSDDLHLYETTNVATAIRIENPNAGTSNSLNLNLFSDTTAGYLQFQKRSSTHTATGIVVANSGLLYNSKGDLIIATADATSWIRFATNGITTADLNLTNNGRLLLGHSTEDTYILDVQGQNSRFGGTTNYTVLYSQANGGGIGLFKSDILLSNLIQNELYIDAGIATGDPIRMYVTDVLVPGTVRPLCINGNGRETVFGSDTTTNTASSLVTLVSTTKGFLPPRMTSAQRTAISSPATGLIVYQTDSTAGLYLRNSGSWSLLGVGSGSVTDVSVVTANGFAGTVATSTTTPAITLTTTITGILKGNGTAISAAVAGTDYSTRNIYENDYFLTSERVMDLNEYNLHLNGPGGRQGLQYVYTKRGVVPGMQVLYLTSDRTLSLGTTAQRIFATSNDTLNTYGNEILMFEALIYIIGMSATSGNITIDIKGAGSVTIASILYSTYGLDANAPTTAAALGGGVSITSAFVTPVTATTGTQLVLTIKGSMRITSLGLQTIIPTVSLTTSVLTAQIKQGSYFSMYPIGIASSQKIEDLA